ncbi:MBL fold metallo-hydrolase [Pseudomonas azotoformans]|uniref:MBL fold metallo-hydrolase n=1 Tax=Pseudomonas azotoformans TaxID=47878 RepID=UPI001147A604|nr:MBL fold metallo-hydrolase [Pseudomonas azotoformans]QDH63636.1 MBL fold metallo-hydrolase [Pseudomonas azotoformans]
MPIILHKPADAELEVSLFGPGTGECIVAHLGNDKWMIVDSCTAPNRKPVALEYLASINVSLDDVVLVVVSHFHDDHIRGIGEVIDQCKNAKVCISGALTEKEMIAFAMAHSPGDIFVDLASPSTHELAKVLAMIDIEGGKRSYTLVSEDKILHRQGSAEVVALSPSDRAVVQAKLNFDTLIADAAIKFRKLANKPAPNLCAIALHICNGVDTILLGSDLEVSGNSHLGWEPVLLSKARPTSLAAVFKVSHHGSVTGHSDEVVRTMLKPKPISILTTMNSSYLPRAADVERIRAYSSAVYMTTQRMERLTSRARAVDEVFKEVVKKRRVINNSVGHVQVRMLNGVVSVTLNEHASTLS